MPNISSLDYVPFSSTIPKLHTLTFSSVNTISGTLVTMRIALGRPSVDHSDDDPCNSSTGACPLVMGCDDPLLSADDSSSLAISENSITHDEYLDGLHTHSLANISSHYSLDND
jgi:hypothetical protein